jgi:hypothetical protein
MLVQLADPLHAELSDHLFADQVVGPDPRQSAKTHFQRARPIDSPVVWIRREPALELRANLVEIIGVSRETERLRQQHQMLMTIRLPDYFVIAAAPHVQIGDSAKISQIALNPTSVIAAPGDFGAGVYGKAEDWKLMLPNLFREPDCFFCECGSMKCTCDGHRIGKLNSRFEVGIKIWLRRPRVLISVDQLLLQPKPDLTECAQCSSFYPELKNGLAANELKCTGIKRLRSFAFIRGQIFLPRIAIIETP